jgi:hypothetical protein
VRYRLRPQSCSLSRRNPVIATGAILAIGIVMLAVQSAELSSAPAASERPFYFIVILWGERFRDYFLEFCLPSLLSPGNIPALEPSRRSKFLIATRPDDWAAMKGTEIFRTLERHLEPVFVELPPCPPNRSGYQHMSVGHGLACAMAHRDKAYAVLLTPDCMLSDGSVARLAELARAGTELVLTAALRFGEEPFMAHLESLGVLPTLSRGASGMPLDISGRLMAFAAVNGLHTETLAYAWDEPGFLLVLPAAWWRVPGQNGILLHCLSWAPVLLDYGAIGGDHDISTFDQWTLDGDYLFNNSRNLKQIHVVQDSDELFLASWGPMAERPIAKHFIPLLGKLVAKAQFGANYRNAFFDPLKRRLFFLPVRWHGESLNAEWAAVESRAKRELLHYTTPPGATVLAGADGLAEKLWRIFGHTLAVVFVLLRPLFIALYYHKAVWRKLRQIARGERGALREFFWYVRLFGFNKY